MSRADIQECREVIAELLRRDGSIELTPVGHDAGQTVTPSFRSRLLSAKGDALLVERPANPDAVRWLVPQTALRVLVVKGNERFEFDTSIAGLVKHRLNASTPMMALQLTNARNIRSAQRRTYFRVSTAAARLEPALLLPLAPGVQLPGPSKSLESPKSFSARLLNVGGGGVGVEAPQSVGWQLSGVSRYSVSVFLPDLTEPLNIKSRVVHLQRQHGGTHYLGLSFEYNDDLHRRHCEDQICSFTAEHQRSQLRRRRSS